MVDLVDRIDCIDSETLDSCVLLQQDEIAALEAIYDNLWTCVDLNKFEIKIYPSSDKLEQFVVLLSIQFTETYPLNEPPLFQISAPWMKPLEKEILNDILIECYLSNYHEPVVFKWITEINEFTESCLQHRKNAKTDDIQHRNRDVVKCSDYGALSLDRLLQIEQSLVSSELILERKSYFQGHCIAVSSKTDVDDVMLYLKSIPKIAKATHNIMTYRFTDERNILHADYDEDGETNAGGRVAHLLELTKLSNVMVVVSRWFGGILLGPDRFKLINQAARSALVKGKFLS
ncbi:protein IMPACT-B-like [Symsagittifera roscoffensis]|uniref:protein IMPACT-B-like n=1 Tax=Symsagittifera roscoffensis TaxID=84072 RepID=UPI00307C6E82